ncbi:MAG: 2-oxo acid dehydrogenase subunit E2 [Actinomycetota bacterium]|nr:2-oxo acid dehydrogenase subunit E2 [Actinomycetota bacterium]
MPDITMPQLGETVTEGTIIKWHKQVGDQVAEDETLFEVSTDKVDSEVPSSTAGYVTEILVDEGETVDVGAKLAVVSDEPPGDANDKAAEPDEAEAAPEPPAEEPASGDEGKTGDGAAEPDQQEQQPEPAPAQAAGDGQESDGQAPREPSGAESGKLLSPVVRRLIAEHQLDPDQIPGSGQGGRITRADVLAFIDKEVTSRPTAEREAPAQPAAQTKPAAEAKPAAPAKAKPAAAAKPQSGDDEIVPFSNIRRRTAEHMVRSVATSAHVLTATEVDFFNVDRVRAQVKNEFKAKEGFSLTYLPFIARAVVDAIEDFPHVNSSVGDDQLIVHRRVHLGIAVDINFEGLIVPVIHDADSQRLRALARTAADLARRARSRELTADDISGGTFTITNPGPFGTFLTSPIINQPQVAILSTDGVKKRPVAIPLPDGSDGIAVHPVGNLALTFDHRAFDGAYAAAFIARCKEILETRDWSAEL